MFNRLNTSVMKNEMTRANEILDKISELTVMDCVELTKDIEERFNVKASDVVVQMLPVTEQAVVEEMIEELDVIVMLISYGDKRVSVIKAVRSILGLQLKESLELVRSVPVQIGDSMAPIEAEELKRILEDAGGKVTIE
jgi:large subunit ribosomal protein L7/L12